MPRQARHAANAYRSMVIPQCVWALMRPGMSTWSSPTSTSPPAAPQTYFWRAATEGSTSTMTPRETTTEWRSSTRASSCGSTGTTQRACTIISTESLLLLLLLVLLPAVDDKEEGEDEDDEEDLSALLEGAAPFISI